MNETQEPTAIERAKEIYDTAATAMKQLILEELASFEQFPQMDVADIDRPSMEAQYSNSTLEEGILVRPTIGPSGIAAALARAMVLKKDGAYNYAGGLALKEGVMNISFIQEAIVRKGGEYRPVHDRIYLARHSEFLSAIQRAREIQAKS
jgi:hypothetical protein